MVMITHMTKFRNVFRPVHLSLIRILNESTLQSHTQHYTHVTARGTRTRTHIRTKRRHTGSSVQLFLLRNMCPSATSVIFCIISSSNATSLVLTPYRSRTTVSPARSRYCIRKQQQLSPKTSVQTLAETQDTDVPRGWHPV